ncbi:MAG: hypothetical protein ACE5I2_00835 [Anaerolineae bacterium]
MKMLKNLVVGRVGLVLAVASLLVLAIQSGLAFAGIGTSPSPR